MKNTIPEACGAGAALLALILIAAAGAVRAADPPKPDAATSKPMNMEAPMQTGMAKPGMKLGDVKKAAEKEDRKMRDALKKEEQSAGPAKK